MAGDPNAAMEELQRQLGRTVIGINYAYGAGIVNAEQHALMLHWLGYDTNLVFIGQDSKRLPENQCLATGDEDITCDEDLKSTSSETGLETGPILEQLSNTNARDDGSHVGSKLNFAPASNVNTRDDDSHIVPKLNLAPTVASNTPGELHDRQREAYNQLSALQGNDSKGIYVLGSSGGARITTTTLPDFEKLDKKIMEEQGLHIDWENVEFVPFESEFAPHTVGREQKNASAQDIGTSLGNDLGVRPSSPTLPTASRPWASSNDNKLAAKWHDWTHKSPAGTSDAKKSSDDIRREFKERVRNKAMRSSEINNEHLEAALDDIQTFKKNQEAGFKYQSNGKRQPHEHAREVTNTRETKTQKVNEDDFPARKGTQEAELKSQNNGKLQSQKRADETTGVRQTWVDKFDEQLW